MRFHIILFLFAGITIISCNKSDKSSKEIRDAYSANSDSLITQEQFRIFYQSLRADSFLVRNVNAFYADRGDMLAWNIEGELTASADNLYERVMEHMYTERDSPLIFIRLHEVWNEPLNNIPTGLSAPVYIDLLLTTSYFRYAQKTYSGSVKNLARLEWYIPRTRVDYAILLQELLSGNTEEGPLQQNQYYQLLKQNLIHYREIEDRGGWPLVPAKVSALSVNDTSNAVVSLRKLLFLTGDLDTKDTVSGLYDRHITSAIILFQERHGLSQTGVIDSATLANLNISVEKRISQILINMERMRWFSPPDIGENFLLVNIPDYELHAFEGGKLAWEMNVVVGTDINRTTVFRGKLSQIVLNPYWNIPESIITNEMLVHFLEDADAYATNENLEIIKENEPVVASQIDWTDEDEVNKVRIRQLPGEGNALGQYKFLFPNSFSIYLHDTPAKHLFSQDTRSFSHGCIRISDPEKLANYLLRNNPKWSQEKINSVIATGKETFINLENPIPVYIVYFTSWVDEKGKLNFRDDPYGHDKKLGRELFTHNKRT